VFFLVLGVALEARRGKGSRRRKVEIFSTVSNGRDIGGGKGSCKGMLVVV